MTQSSNRTYPRRQILALATSVLAGCGTSQKSDQDKKVLRIVPDADLKILDPHATSLYTTRDHGHMIYDTLFGMDVEGRIAKQMVDDYQVSADGRTWTFTLREGLSFHDGSPVTSGDVIASIQRWCQVDSMGQALQAAMTSSGWSEVNTRTFEIKLQQRYGPLLESLAKPDSYVPFILPARVAQTPATRAIDDFTGSGPFIFQKDEWRPGEKVVYVRNMKYRPRTEPASGTAGGKVVKVDRVEWITIRDGQTQANALTTGEVDLVSYPAFEQYATFKSNPDLQLVAGGGFGYGYFLRFNHVAPPFDSQKVRRAAMAALNQPDFLQAQVGIRELYQTCFSIYPCGSPYATRKGLEFLEQPNPAHARELLQDSGYDGAPVTILQASDLVILAKTALVAARLLTDVGFVVKVDSMDMATLQERRRRKDGWSLFLSYGTRMARRNPITSLQLIASGYPNAWFGWPSDPELERLRKDFAFTTTDDERKAIAEAVQVRAMEVGTQVPLGEFKMPLAARKNVTGFVPNPFPVFWNLEKS